LYEAARRVVEDLQNSMKSENALALHPAFHHEADQVSFHFLAFSGNISNFVKLGYCTTSPPQTYQSQPSVLTPASQN